MKCNKLIETIYRNKDINNFIGKIKPEHLRDDLKQEMALVLLSYDCEKLQRMDSENNLIRFTIKVLYIMAYLTYNPFYNNFRKKHVDGNYEYIRRLSLDDNVQVPANIAITHLSKKMMIDANHAHESMIFSKYVEMRSIDKVSEYFGIPRQHTWEVIKNVRNELKKKIKKQV